MTTIVSSEGQVVLPAELRRMDDVRPGERFEIERVDRGEYRLTRLARRPSAGLLSLLLAWRARPGDGSSLWIALKPPMIFRRLADDDVPRRRKRAQ